MVTGDVSYATPEYSSGTKKKRNMNDDRYITEEYDGGVRITMKVYKEWVEENGEAQVFHKTDTEKFDV
tara:strand:- start:449 stop:652 length:204 start_codon:yes stop_codon:yes gene_type:complete